MKSVIYIKKNIQLNGTTSKKSNTINCNYVYAIAT